MTDPPEAPGTPEPVALRVPAVAAREAALDVPLGPWVTSRGTRLGEAFVRLAGLPRLLLEHRDLVTTSVRRDLEARFRGTLLGWFWPLVHPLFLFVVYYFIFTKLLAFKFGTLPKEQESAMGVFMFTGVVPWATLSDSLNRGANVIVDSGNLIKKLAFPSEILPLNVTLVGIVTMLFAVVVFVVGVNVSPVWPGTGPLWWLPAILLAQIAFTYGLTLALSTLQVFLRDTLQVVAIVTTVWMFVTPIFWVPELIPGMDRFLPTIHVNPVYHMIQAYRGVLMGDVIDPNDPTLYYVSEAAIGHHLWTFSLWAAGTFVFGYVFFVLCQRRFADEV